MNMNKKNIGIYKMKFDPRYAILAVLLILAVFKITQKERYMCGGKREGYKPGSRRGGRGMARGGGGGKMMGGAGGPMLDRRMPALEAKPIKKEGYCAKCGSGGQVFGKPCPKCKGGKEGYCSSCGV